MKSSLLEGSCGRAYASAFRTGELGRLFFGRRLAFPHCFMLDVSLPSVRWRRGGVDLGIFSLCVDDGSSTRVWNFKLMFETAELRSKSVG